LKNVKQIRKTPCLFSRKVQKG